MSEIPNSGITVYRNKRGFKDRFRKYNIEIDGEQVGQLSVGGNLDVTLEPGEHSIRAKIDWAASEMICFSVGADQWHSARCESSRGLPLHSLFRPGSYLSIIVEDP